MKRVKKFFTDFKAFISRGNVIDLAVGVIIGGAFSAIVTALTNKIIMPLINLLLSIGGGGLDSAYTFLKVAYQYDANGDVLMDSITGQKVIDLANSIYIDWGAFITAIIDFLLIAFVLFLILKAIMGAKGYWKKSVKEWPTKEERKALKAQGVDMEDRKVVIAATKEFREKNKPVPPAPKPTQEQLLAGILEELKKQNAEKETKEMQEVEVAEEKPKIRRTKKLIFLKSIKKK